MPVRKLCLFRSQSKVKQELNPRLRRIITDYVVVSSEQEIEKSEDYDRQPRGVVVNFRDRGARKVTTSRGGACNRTWFTPEATRRAIIANLGAVVDLLRCVVAILVRQYRTQLSSLI